MNAWRIRQSSKYKWKKKLVGWEMFPSLFMRIFFKLPFKIYIENYSTSMFLVFQNYYIFSYILYRMTSGRSTYLHIEAAQILIKKHFKSIRYNNMTLTTWIIKLTSLGSLEIWTLVRLVTQQVGQPKKKMGLLCHNPLSHKSYRVIACHYLAD